MEFINQSLDLTMKYVNFGRRRYMIYGRTKNRSARVNIEVMWLVFRIETGPGMKVVKVTQENRSGENYRHNMP
jgi:hypothetical protein